MSKGISHKKNKKTKKLTVAPALAAEVHGQAVHWANASLVAVATALLEVEEELEEAVAVQSRPLEVASAGAKA
jgi:hypothetical protein